MSVVAPPQPHTYVQILALSEGVELGHAWVQRLVREAGARALFIKGPALAAQGLRAERTSSDVDVLVAPDDFERVCDAILASGWRERPGTLISSLTSVHSRTFLHNLWPCDIDVHRHYPGMLASPHDAFEALWAERTTVDFARQPCDVPNRVGNTIILALHSLRGTERQQRHAAELAALRGIPLTDAERIQLARMASRTGSIATLSDVLPHLGVTIAPSADELASPDLRRWRERLASGWHGAYFWSIGFRNARGIDRVRVLHLAIWPSRTDLLLSRPETVDTALGRLTARVRRWGRGARSLPRAVRAMRGSRDADRITHAHAPDAAHGRSL